MIGDVLSLLRDQLDAFLRAAAPALDENPADARVQLPDGAKADPIEFRLNAITLLLVNIEQETGLRTDVAPFLERPVDARWLDIPNLESLLDVQTGGAGD